jgi:cytochrome c oxidase assembly protein subunit 15
MPASPHNPWLHRFAVLTALATLGLIAIGGLVTSQGVGMAVPDWPTSYGYNMFLFPISKWVGGVFYEHTHRLVATIVGILVVALTRWLGGRGSCKPLMIIGLLELAAGAVLLKLAPELKGAGYFLSGIGLVVLLAGFVWLRNEPAAPAVQKLGWLAFTLVQVQGLLGGLRVVLFNDQIGIFHAALAQIFFVLLCAIALLTSRWWRVHAIYSLAPSEGERAGVRGCVPASPAERSSPLIQSFSPSGGEGVRTADSQPLRRLLLAGTLLIFFQLTLGAAMRHQHAGLAIPDFPLAYHKLWPPMDSASVARYNQLRLDERDFNPITAFQIGLQMAHRVVALGIFCVVSWCAWFARRKLGPRHPLTRFSLAWLGLILLQILLGAATIWYNKPADIATAHVVVGALSLVAGALLTIVSFRVLIPGRVPILPLPDSSQTRLVSDRPVVAAAK